MRKPVERRGLNGTPQAALPRRETPGVIYPLSPLSSSRNFVDVLHEPDKGSSGQQMSRRLPLPDHGFSNKSASARPFIGHTSAGPSRPQHAPYLPLPSDIPADPDSPVSEQTAELLHEFVHPHHHRSQENLHEADEFDEPGGDASVIAKELEEMRSRVWWKRPSAVWYAPPLHAAL